MDCSKTALSNTGKADTMSMTMSFAYIEGQEAEALAYYEERLKTTRDPQEQKQLAETVENLRREAKKKNQPMPSFSLSSLSLKCV